MRKICVVTGTRAEYGLLRPVMRAIKESENLQLQIIATGMHLSERHGNSYQEIIKDGFKIDDSVKTDSEDDTGHGMNIAIAKGIEGLSQAFIKLQPDVVLILGDRTEALAAAISASYLNIPVAHLHGGDRTMAGLDESARHAITKFAHIHFPATPYSEERIKKMGEDFWRIHYVGSPAIDEILNEELFSKEELESNINAKLEEKYLLVVQHPVSTQPSESVNQITETLEAIKLLGMQAIIIYPNSDSGGRAIIEKIKKYEDLDNVISYTNLSHKEYLSLMKYAAVLVGNSSSGMTESASFKIPVVNIGIRQNGRDRSDNVIDAGHDRNQILLAIEKALSDEFKKNMKSVNLYGDGTAGKRIANILSDIVIDKKLLHKTNSY
ncbi:MAG TPA: UDP-N-acetylglucosamine 2-epimerase [Alphaproteobacteria bacterium]|nr:UDP-N-acetylglucosamine 2-epimerase [Alphaproteobacteria bacterium]